VGWKNLELLPTRQTATTTHAAIGVGTKHVPSIEARNGHCQCVAVAFPALRPNFPSSYDADLTSRRCRLKLSSWVHERTKSQIVGGGRFQPTPLEGNSLAVFFDAHGLTDSQMHAIAREMNLSETTTIIFPRETEGDRGVHVRIRRPVQRRAPRQHRWSHFACAIPTSARHDRTKELKSGPSQIYVRASLQDNRVVNVRVGGNAVEVMRGDLLL